MRLKKQWWWWNTKRKIETYFSQKSNQIFKFSWNTGMQWINLIKLLFNAINDIASNKLQQTKKMGKYHCHTVFDTQMNWCEILCITNLNEVEKRISETFWRTFNLIACYTLKIYSHAHNVLPQFVRLHHWCSI